MKNDICHANSSGLVFDILTGLLSHAVANEGIVTNRRFNDMLSVGGGSMTRRRWADRRSASVTKITIIAAALLSSYFSLPALEILEKAEDIQFSNPNIPLDVDSANSTLPRIGSDPSGVLHAVWTDPRFGDKNIAYTKSEDNGTTWTTVTNISKAWTGFYSMSPDITVDTGAGPYGGSIYVVYERIIPGGGRDIYTSFSRDGGDTWVQSIRVDHAPPGITSARPCVSVGNDGTVYVAWDDMRVPGSIYQVFAAKSIDGGMTWSGDIQISQSFLINVFPAIATDRDGNVYIAWQEYNENETTSILVAKSTDGINWTTSTVATGGNYSTSRRVPDIIVDDSGSVLVTWMFCDSDGNDFVQFSRSDDGGKSWISPIQVSHGSPVMVTSMVTPRLASDRGTIYITWSDNRNGDHDIWLAQSVDGGSHWGDGNIQPQDVRVDDTGNNGDPSDDASWQSYADIAVYDFTVVVIWQDYRSDTDYDVYFARHEISSLQITEVSDSPAGSEWIEVYNFGSKSLDAAPYSLRLSGVVVDLDPLGIIGPQEYRIIGDLPGADLFVDIDIDDEGVDIWLKKSGLTKERFLFGQKGPNPDPLEGESVARHWSGERYTRDWNRETTPTVRQENDVPPSNHDPDVALNEVLFNPSNPSDLFVEVYYPGWDSVSLAGYKIVCDSEATLGAITLSPSNREAVLRYASNPPFFSDMTSTGDNVYLYDSNGRLLDMVGWSSSHTQGLSVSRVPDGFGTHDGYNDVTSEIAGWAFDVLPTLWFVRIGPDQAKNGEANEEVRYELTVTNKDLSSHYFNINYSSGAEGWVVGLYEADGVTPLADSVGDPDTIPDVGLLSPEESRSMVVGVTIPSSYSVNVVEGTMVFATASNDPTISDFAVLRTRPYPGVEVSKTASPTTIFVETSGPEFQTEATITLEISGIGSSVEWHTPQDVIFLIDQSWSIGDAFGLERQVALNYLENLKGPDMAAAIYFEWFPEPRRPLSSNYEQVRLDIYSETRVSEWAETPSSSFTRVSEALIAALREFEMNGNDSHSRIIILITDGFCTSNQDALGAAELAKEKRTRVYTLGITGKSGVDEATLESIANISGGEYMQIDDQYGFDGMYENISHFVDDTAARDPDQFDEVAMIDDMLPWYVHYVPGSFKDPATGAARPPDLLVSSPSGSEFKWFNRVLRVGETWSVSFNVTVAITGLISADLYPESKVNYASWNWTNMSVPFPITTIMVLPPIHPPTNVTASLEGSAYEDVRVSWTPSVDDPAIVDQYDVYYGTTHHSEGSGYSLLASVPKGSDSAVHTGGGEGDPNNYFYRVCAVAASGGSVCSSDQAGKFTRPLAQGPNLISIPLKPSNESVELVLQTVMYDKAWFYDSSSQEWKWYMTSKGYRKGLLNINHTMGMWVNVTGDCGLTVAGIVPAQTTIHLNEGWNLVSFPSFNTPYTVADLKIETGSTRVEGFDPAPPHHLRVLGDGEMLQAGYGYWVNVDAETDWIVELS
jgi:hypothetical protein